MDIVTYQMGQKSITFVISLQEGLKATITAELEDVEKNEVEDKSL